MSYIKNSLQYELEMYYTLQSNIDEYSYEQMRRGTFNPIIKKVSVIQSRLKSFRNSKNK